MKTLIHYRAQCLDCLDIIESTHDHDFKTCSCWNAKKKIGIFIDGGLKYPRCGCYDWEKFKDMSKFEGEDDPVPSKPCIHPLWQMWKDFFRRWLKNVTDSNSKGFD